MLQHMLFNCTDNITVKRWCNDIVCLIQSLLIFFTLIVSLCKTGLIKMGKRHIMVRVHEYFMWTVFKVVTQCSFYLTMSAVMKWNVSLSVSFTSLLSSVNIPNGSLSNISVWNQSPLTSDWQSPHLFSQCFLDYILFLWTGSSQEWKTASCEIT